MKLSILAGSTSITVNVFVRDSSSTTGAGLTGLAFNTASLVAYYGLVRAAAVQITLATQTVTGAWSSGGFVEISSANMPGWYRLDIPDAALASGRFVSIHMKGAANMAPLPIEIELTAVNNQSATAFMTSVATVTNLTNAPTAGDLTATMKTSVTTAATAATPAVTVSDKTGFSLSTAGILAIWHQLTAAIVTASTIGKLIVDFLDAAVSTRTKPADTQARVTLVDTVTAYTGNTPQTGDAFARIGAAGAGLTALGDTRIANLDATVSSRLATAGYTVPPTAAANADAVWDELIAGHLGAGSTGAALNVAGAVGDPWTTPLPGAYGAGTAGFLVGTNLDAPVSDVPTAAENATANWAAGTRALTDKSDFALTAAYDPAKTAAQAGDAMALTSGERTTLAGVVWASASRTLTSFGSLVADVASAVWGVASRTLTSFGFTVGALVADKTGFSLTSAYDPAMTAAQPGDVPTAATVADKVLGRNLAGGSDGGRTVRDALRPARNKVTIVGSTVTVYEEDDTTPAWTGTLTTNPAAEPITAMDPVE